MIDYWDDICQKCFHTRKFHGEGGCNASVFSIFSPVWDGVRCGCLVPQSQISRKEK